MVGGQWVGGIPVGGSVEDRSLGRWSYCWWLVACGLSVVGGFVIRRLQKNSSAEQMIVINDVLNIRY